MSEATSEPDGTPDETPDDPQQAVADARRALQEAEAEAKRVAEAEQLASLLGLPDQLPLTWCALCKADVKPYGKGICPRCHKFVKGSFAARKHPVNLLRRDVILSKLIADYQPPTTLLRSSCEMLAGILEQLEMLKPGSPEHQRLVQLSQTLGAALEASRSARIAALPDLGALSDEQLIERTTEILRTLLSSAAPKPGCSTASERGDLKRSGPGSDPGARPSESAVEFSEFPSSPPVCPSSPPVCPYCRRPCVGRDHIAYDVLHWTDPEQVARRDEEATKVMLAQMGKRSPWL